MDVVVVGFGLVIAVAAAVRSTWSPCGQSMLSQITPIAEAGRGHKFETTATWFIGGALAGGVTLGAVIAAAATLVARADLTDTTAIALVSIGALVAAAVDARVLGAGPPFLRRQVNEVWLTKYRSWVYGAGFGWQIGAGITTYVMTAAVPLLIVVGALTGSWAAALALGTGFGLVRGLAVLLGTRLRTPSALLEFHRRFSALAEPVRQAVIYVQLAVAVVAAWIATPAPVATGISIGAIVLLVITMRREPAVRASTTPALRTE